jgi:hypothetical protein
MKKQRESDADLRIRVKTGNQRLGDRVRSEQGVSKIGFGGRAKLGEALVLGECADQPMEVGDVVLRRSNDPHAVLVQRHRRTGWNVTTAARG